MKVVGKFLNKGTLCLAAALFISAPAWALNTQLHRPTTGETGGYRVHTTETLKAHRTAIGFDVNFADDLFESNVANPFLRNNIDVVDQLATFDFLMSYGLTDWLEFNLDLPVHFFNDINFTGAENQWDAEPGDLLFNFKARIIDAEANDSGIGLAFIPFITAPTGQLGSFQGNSTVTGGFHVAAEKRFERTRLYANIGSRFRREEMVSFIDSVQHEMLYGAGVQHTLLEDHALDMIMEVVGSTDFDAEITSPAEFIGMLRKTWGDEDHFITHGGFGVGLGDGYGAPDWRVFFGLAYAFGGVDKAPPPPPPAKKEAKREPPVKIDLRGQINFKTDSAVILASSYPLLDDAVAKMKRHPEILLVEIEGHTDSRGSDVYNKDLSQRRADSVRDYFVQKGIEPSRLTTMGYGEERPIAPNDTPENMRKNRRIVFSVKDWK